MAVSREMTKRGFNSSSKSADARTGGEIDLPELAPLPLSPPQVYGQRKKLTDLKIDYSFVPKISKMKKSGLTSPDKASQQPRIRVTNMNNGALNTSK